jgi:hypothetical protein
MRAMVDRRRLLRRIRRTWIAVGLFLLIAMPLYMTFAFSPTGYGPEVLQPDAAIDVQDTDGWLAFLPRRAAAGVSALVFYPGCPVPADSYAPFGRAVAEHGHPAYIIRVPQRCATTKEQQVALYAATERLLASSRRPWVLAGHSRGGAHASQFAADHPAELAGLFLEGTTHPRDVDLSGLRIPVVKVIATKDGVAPEARSRANARLLPPSTTWVRIEGGNHAQFGYYHFQLWDGRPTISRAEQQRQVVQAVVELLNTAQAPVLEEVSGRRYDAKGESR